MELARRWGPRPGVVLQEYLPREDAEDWIVHGYFDSRSNTSRFASYWLSRLVRESKYACTIQSSASSLGRYSWRITPG